MSTARFNSLLPLLTTSYSIFPTHINRRSCNLCCSPHASTTIDAPQHKTESLIVEEINQKKSAKLMGSASLLQGATSLDPRDQTTQDTESLCKITPTLFYCTRANASITKTWPLNNFDTPDWSVFHPTESRFVSAVFRLFPSIDRKKQAIEVFLTPVVLQPYQNMFYFIGAHFLSLLNMHRPMEI